MKLPPRVSLASHADLLRWQVRWRVSAAAVIAAVLTALQWRGMFTGEPAQVAIVFIAYVVTVAAAAVFARSPQAPSPSPRVGVAAYVTILADIAALIAVTAAASGRGAHAWVLVVGFFVVHLAAFSFGRSVAFLAVASSTAGYLLLTVSSGTATLSAWSEAMVAVVAYLAVASTFLSQYSSRRRRLRRIITLFERAEEGDFDQAYDVGADGRPDAVTAVGGAYNRVRARFESLVLTDSLTACLNRRGFEQALARELARADRAASAVALVAVDIDAFKRVNDTYGHMAGDETLHQLGEILLATVRTGDLVARVGGDEFVILCPDTNLAGARQLGTRLCEEISGHAFTGHAAPVRVTISAGIAALDGSTDDHIAAALQLRADRALYDAKRAGRNRVHCWEADGSGVGR